MSMRTRYGVWLAVVVALFSLTGRSAGAYVLPRPDAGSYGLGEAYTAVVNSPAAVYWNAAALGGLSEPQFQSMKTSLLLGDTFTSFAYAQPMGDLGVGVMERRLTLKNIQERDSNGVLRNLLQEDYLDRSVALSLPARDGLRLGMTYHLWTRNLGSLCARAHSVDISGLWHIQKNTRLALVLGSLVSRVSGDRDMIGPAPSKFTRIGIGWNIRKSLLSVDLEQFEDRRSELSFGLEIPVLNSLLFRAGHRDEEWTLGLGLKLGRTSFDLGIQDGRPGSSSCMTTTWRLGRLGTLRKLAGWFKSLTSPPPVPKQPDVTAPDTAAGETITPSTAPVPADTPEQLLARAKLLFLSGDLFTAEQLCREVINGHDSTIRPAAENLQEQIEQVKLINNVKKLAPTR